MTAASADACTTSIDVAALVFAELRTLYGGAFVAEYGEQPDERWRAAIARLSVAELERGLRVLAESRRDRPNVSEFVALCRTGNRFGFVRSAPMGAPDNLDRLAEAAVSPPAVRDRYLAAIRNRLTGGDG